MGTKPLVWDFISTFWPIGVGLVGAYSAIVKSQRNIDSRVTILETRTGEQHNAIVERLAAIEAEIRNQRAIK